MITVKNEVNVFAKTLAWWKSYIKAIGTLISKLTIAGVSEEIP